ncbi:MAG: DMT family transporter [Gemmatimonadota bacterium]|nr:MAG: DMT family transporter [Gemmatimonadota bacterium]
MHRRAYTYAAIAVLFWATVASAFKISLRYLDFLQLLFYASLVSTAALFLIVFIQRKLYLLSRYSGKQYIHSMMLGFLNPFLYYVVLFKAYSLLPAQEAQPLNWTWPITLSVLSIPLLKQRMSLGSFLALCISFSGVFIISTRGNIMDFRFTNPLGVLLAIGSSIVWALFWIFNVRDQRDEVVKLLLNFAFGSIFILITITFFSSIKFSDMRGVFGATYVGLFEMGITFVVWLKALQFSKTTARVSNVIYVTPFFSLIVIYFVLGERILPSSIVGLVLIVTGVIIQQHSSRSHPTSAPVPKS